MQITSSIKKHTYTGNIGGSTKRLLSFIVSYLYRFPERRLPVHVGQQLPGPSDLHCDHRQYRPHSHRLQLV